MPVHSLSEAMYRDDGRLMPPPPEIGIGIARNRENNDPISGISEMTADWLVYSPLGFANWVEFKMERATRVDIPLKIPIRPFSSSDSRCRSR
uniref:Uncharacterized protein n=1 Tax=Candidatus Kentrum sp. FW TaxID=2126338 RepID=A0A450RZU6_9GAMM|nr:MAG: hypothetical protein BECKFW1821A_GA0114235_100845 [Candidatus Kentron sp. FW]